MISLRLDPQPGEVIIDASAMLGGKSTQSVLQDPGDDMVLELAVKARCDFIVTYNQRDFRGIEQFGLQVITPLEFLREIGVIS